MQKKKSKQLKKQNSFSHSTGTSDYQSKKQSTWNSPCRDADKLVNERSEEQERRHGPFSKGMENAAFIASILTGKGITPEDLFKCLISLKLSRIAHSIEFDSMKDLCGYTEGLWNYIQEQKLKEK